MAGWIRGCIMRERASGTNGKEPACQCRKHKRWGFSPWVGKIPWSGLQFVSLQRVGHNWSDLAQQHNSEREAQLSAGTNFQTYEWDHLRPAVLRGWSDDFWWSLVPEALSGDPWDQNYVHSNPKACAFFAFLHSQVCIWIFQRLCDVWLHHCSNG